MNLIADHREDNPYRKPLVRELVAYNHQHAPMPNWQYVGFYALDEARQLAGGIQGNFEWDWLHITHLWVRNRGQGLGRRLVETAEGYAKSQGKQGLFLDTLDFQARPFYERLGFAVIGKIENAAGASSRYFMSKRIS
ncbi:MAG TPA: GNAT family N-acetyltransferase [Rhodopila sp.]|jgi:GNAT superfamily N-acetyltransferase|nr:GNAT family N-acetyltransferase [Rhodopila sp.]